MADKNSTNGGRKSARGERAKKRDEDVLEGDDQSDSKITKVDDDKATATRRGGDASSNGSSNAKSSKASSSSGAKKRTNQPSTSAASTDYVADGQAWLTELFEKMNYDLKVEGSKDGEDYVFNVTGPDADTLIGRSRKSPRTLNSLQTLLAESLGRDARGKVLVDIGGYKQKRKSRLTAIADQLGEAVQQSGKSIKIAGLNSYERRVIHQHLADEGAVDTESVDQGIFRKLRVMPN